MYPDVSLLPATQSKKSRPDHQEQGRRWFRDAGDFHVVLKDEWFCIVCIEFAADLDLVEIRQGTES